MNFVVGIFAIFLFIFLWEITGIGQNKMYFGWNSSLICCFIVLVLISAGVPSVLTAIIFGGG